MAWVRSNGGCDFVSGKIVHEWHGSHRRRAYLRRHLLLDGIDIEAIVERDGSGILRFKDSVPADLRQRFINYFVQRKEDGASGIQ